MDAGQRLFLAQGVGPTTIEQITSGADVAKGTFYLHFSSKEDLRAALGERFAQKHLASIKTALAEIPQAHWSGKLATWARACVRFYVDSIQLHDILFYESRTPTREGVVDNIVITHLSDLLRAGAEAGAWSIDEPRFTAVFLFGGLHGAVDDAYLKERRVSQSRLADHVEGVFIRAVKPALG